MAAPDTKPRSEDLNKEPDLRQQVQQEQDRNLRLLAEFDTFRRRTAREQDGAREQGRRQALLPLLPVLDTLERALDAGSTDPTFYEGVAATHKLFVTAVRATGAEPIESVGLRFDPSVHEAVGTEPSTDYEPGIVSRELQRGWRLGSELLRAARVIVASAPGTNTGES
jgi:molecular chaperone GrpE